MYNIKDFLPTYKFFISEYFYKKAKSRMVFAFFYYRRPIGMFFAVNV